MKSEDFTDDHRTDLLGLAATSGPAQQEHKALEGWNTGGSDGALRAPFATGFLATFFVVLFAGMPPI